MFDARTGGQVVKGGAHGELWELRAGGVRDRAVGVAAQVGDGGVGACDLEAVFSAAVAAGRIFLVMNGCFLCA